MTTLTRNQDQLQFVIGAYREMLAPNKRRLLIRELRLLAEQQGGYLQLFKKADGRFEVALGKEVGYLLGETICNYFGSPANLIFCEAFADDVLLVIVQHNHIFLDAKIAKDQVAQELLPILTGNDQFDVYVCGDVPITEHGNGDQVVLPASKINSFTVLDTPLFPRLPALQEYQLLPLPLALRSPYLSRGFPVWPVAVLLVALVVVGWWAWIPHAPKLQYHHHHHHSQPNKTWRAYRDALSSPSPKMQLLQLAKTIDRLYSLPGWQISKINNQGESVVVSMSNDGGTLTELAAWAKLQGFQYQLGSKAPLLMNELAAPRRLLTNRVDDVQQVVTELIDQLDQLLATQSVTVKDPVFMGKAKRIVFTVHFNNISPAIIILIANELANYPVALDDIDLSISNHLLSGSIQLSAWGL